MILAKVGRLGGAITGDQRLRPRLLYIGAGLTLIKLWPGPCHHCEVHLQAAR